MLSRARHRIPFWLFLPLVPVLDRGTLPGLDHGFLIQPPTRFVGYVFSVEPRGIVLSTCSEGESQVLVRPDRHALGGIQGVTIEAGLCTQFGFKSKNLRFFLPSELLNPDSEMIQGVWQTKTYTGIPSTKSPEQTLTLQAKRVSYDTLEVTWLPDEMGETEFPPLRVQLGQADEMRLLENWKENLLPWKSLRLEYASLALDSPIVVEGKISNFAFESLR